MTTAYTSLLGLALPVTGELSGTWGDTVNDYITKYVDAAVAGVQTISGSQTAVTLSTTNGGVLTSAGSGATGSAQYAIINCTGNPASLLTITAPATSKAYIVINATSTSQSVKVVGAGPTTGVTVASGDKALIAWNGSDFVRIGASAGGSNTQIQYNSSGNLAGSANLTFDGTNLGLGTSTKIQGDFSNGTLANRTLVQTSTTNGATGVIVVPNGTSTFASLYAANAAAPTNASTIGITTATGATYLTSTRFGTGTFVPLQLLTSDTVRASIATDGTISLGSTAGSESLRVTPVASAVNYAQASGAITGSAPTIAATGTDTNVDLQLSAKGTGAIRIGTLTGLLKGTSGAVSAAVAGTDYAAATTGTNAQLLANNGSGGFSNVTVGSGLTYSAGTLSAASTTSIGLVRAVAINCILP